MTQHNGERTIVLILSMMITFVAGYNICDYIHSDPSCPTEDSCSINYHDGAWTITPVKP